MFEMVIYFFRGINNEKMEEIEVIKGTSPQDCEQKAIEKYGSKRFDLFCEKPVFK
jgi:hypothetical protein